MTYLIIGADQKQYGPVGTEEVHRWIAEGRANAQTSARPEGGTGWRPLSSFPEFAAALARVSAPAAFAVHPAGSGASSQTNGLAIAGFVMGLASVILCCISPVFSILGLIFSIIGLAQINRQPLQGGKGLGIAGIILCVLGLLLFGFFVLIGAVGSVMQGVQ